MRKYLLLKITISQRKIRIFGVTDHKILQGAIETWRVGIISLMSYVNGTLTAHAAPS